MKIWKRLFNIYAPNQGASLKVLDLPKRQLYNFKLFNLNLVNLVDFTMRAHDDCQVCTTGAKDIETNWLTALSEMIEKMPNVRKIKLDLTY